MFKPHLKRSTNNHQTASKASHPFSHYSSQKQPIPRKQTRRIIPEYLFEESKSTFVNKHNKNQLIGILNTHDIEYPKQVESEMGSQGGSGYIQIKQRIFCYFKDKSIFFWRYCKNDLAVVKKFLKHIFDQPIYAVGLCELKNSELKPEPLTLLAVSFGFRIQLFHLQNFQQQSSRNATIEDLKIIIRGMDIITKIQIINQAYGETGESNSLIFYGDISGNVSMFDLKLKMKYINDNWIRYLNRVVTPETRTQTLFKQIIKQSSFVYCLSEKYHKTDALRKKIQRMLKMRDGFIGTEQYLSIYRIIKNKDTNGETCIRGFRPYQEISCSQLYKKIQNSFGNCFKKKQLLLQNSMIVESISLQGSNLNVLFRNGYSIFIDENFSFSDRPNQPMSMPYCFNLCSQKQDPKEVNHYDNLIVGDGNKIQVYEDFIGAGNLQRQVYFTPFIGTNFEVVFQNSLWEYRHKQEKQEQSQFILFGKKSIVFIEKLTPPQIILAYSLCLTKGQEEFENQMVPRHEYFQAKIKGLVQIWGETIFLYQCFKILSIRNKFSSYRLSLRKDIVENIQKELSSKAVTSQNVSKQKYAENQRNFLKRQDFWVTQKTYQIIWNNIHKYSDYKVEIQRLYGSQISNIEAICLVFQISISQIFKEIKSWNSKSFRFYRKKVYDTINSARNIEILLKQFIAQEKRNFQQTSTQNTLLQISQSSQQRKILSSFQSANTPQALFCELCSQTINKVVILLELYDFISEMDINNKKIPTIEELFFSYDQAQILSFASQIIDILEHGNHVLLQILSEKIPDLNIPLLRRFRTWKKMYVQLPNKEDHSNDQTADEIYENQIQQVKQILKRPHYQVLYAHFVNQANINKLSCESTLKAKALMNIIVLLIALMKKVHQLKSKMIGLGNLLQNYKKKVNDYFAILEIPGLRQEYSSLVNQRQFYLDQCSGLISYIFTLYHNRKIGKKAIYEILEEIKKQLPVQLKPKLLEHLKKNEIQELSNVITQRQLFMEIERKQSSRVMGNNSMIRRQLG